MMTRYRFLPWSRRGLAAHNQTQDQGNALSQRGQLSVGIDISHLNLSGPDVSLYGPGDIQGVDQNLVVRCSPREGSRDAEPNYLAAIDFDPPDFPWMFTPARAGNKERLRPWLVLIVVDAAVVDAPRHQRGRPLPTLAIDSEVSPQELPDLTESWAWAHTQLLTPGNEDAPLDQALADNPDLNVSRLLCPRRLQQNRSWHACLVPAFDAGVVRGLGGVPDPLVALGPAWSMPRPGNLVLPVYYHWSFSTGVLGDFESLARKLRPFSVPDTVGVTSLFIGDAGPELPVAAPSDPDSTVSMDGVLRSHTLNTVAFDTTPTTTINALRETLNAPARQLEAGPDNATQALGPPIYGQWHTNRHTISTDDKGWLAELNLEPRARVAAALGTDIVRTHQQEFMQECWRQSGAVNKANNLLNWARLGYEASRRLHARHVESQPDDRLIQFAAALHQRTTFESQNINQHLSGSSMPHATVDMAYRRYLNPNRSLIRRTVHRLARKNQLSNDFLEDRRSRLVPRLAKGHRSVEPTGYMPDGILGSRVFDALQQGHYSHVAGVAISKANARRLQAPTIPLSQTDFQATPLKLKVRANLTRTGLINSTHVDNLRLLHGLDSTLDTGTLNIASTLTALLTQSGAEPDLKGAVIEILVGKPVAITPLFVLDDGTIQIKRPGEDSRVTVGRIDPDTVAKKLPIDQLITVLPPGTFNLGSSARVVIGGDVVGGLTLKTSPGTRVTITAAHEVTASPVSADTQATPAQNDGTPLQDETIGDSVMISLPTTGIGSGAILTQADTIGPRAAAQVNNTVAAPSRNASMIRAFSTTFNRFSVAARLDAVVPKGRLVSFPLSGVARELRTRLDPRIVVPHRLRELVNVRERDVWQHEARDFGVHLPDTFDRILSAPSLDAPMYEYLARLSQERFCPGIGEIPPNVMTVLATNPSFVAAFLVGMNHEMNRELLWRRYPTDQRGTPIRHFWRWSDGRPDIKPIHQWKKKAPLGELSRGAGPEGQTVLLVRGEVLRRYPNAILRAWRAMPDGKEPVELNATNPDDILDPVFMGHLGEDISFAGFELSPLELLAGGGWFFVIQEQPTDPRFGLDVDTNSTSDQALSSWNLANWAHTDVAPGQYMSLEAGGRLRGLEFNGSVFGENSAHMASVLMQKPFQVVVHARHILPVPA